VYNAIEKTAQTKNYAFVLDKAGSATLLYVDPKHDISDDILQQLGYGTQSKGAKK
jgi:Skp family chaperone for outer membrane proteins